jgi:hypothetical protein
MKTLHRFTNNPFAAHATRLPAIVALGAMLATVFWFCSAPEGIAGGCTVCHKRTESITLDCNSLEYRRHIDHGDPTGSCPSSLVAKDKKAPKK